MCKITKISNFFRNTFFSLLSIGLTFFIIGGCALFVMVLQLPNTEQLKDVHLQVPLKIYTADNKLLGEFGEKRRTPVDLVQIPQPLIQAVIDTEDKRFYEHSGIDFIGLARATRELFITGRKTQGASTITMQVARNFFLTRKKTFYRKFREMLLALKIDHEFSKNQILELYLNKVYFGNRSYGVAAAAQTYYGKNLNQLTLSEMAMIGGLPQAPSRDNPLSNPRGAILRRNHVLERMRDNGDISNTEYQKAIKAPVTAKFHSQKITVYAPYIAEMVRKEMIKQFGKDAYEKGLTVYTTINSKKQQYATQALINGLIAYTERHGYRGPEANIGTPKGDYQLEWRDYLDKLPTISDLTAAAVTEVDQQSIQALLANGQTITINWDNLNWARPKLKDGYVGEAPTTASDIVKVGDIIRVLKINQQWRLEQIPQVTGALVALNPNNGAILALNGGFSYTIDKFNNVTQAERQPGSSFKPFVYSAALNKGFTLASIINDAPVVMEDSGANSLWRPQNVTRKFYGPTRLKVGLIESRNLVSIRILQDIGIKYAINYIKQFGFDPNDLPKSLSLALGTGVVTPLSLANGYAVFANGGYKVTPFLINRVIDENGNVLYQAYPATAPKPNRRNSTLDLPQQQAEQIITPQNAYLITNALQDVIKQGTGKLASNLRRSDLAGKTGTTNNQIDAWFSGFNSNLVATIWVGKKQPDSIHEYGAQAALPIWVDFMGQALRGTPNSSMRRPPRIITVRIDPKTGLLAYPGQSNAIFEVFRKAFMPQQTANNENTTNDTDSNSNQDSDAELF